MATLRCSAILFGVLLVAEAGTAQTTIVTTTVVFSQSGDAPGDQLGHALAVLGDVDGDGVSDVLVSAPYADLAGQADAGGVMLLSGADGSLLWRAGGERPGVLFGWSIARAGDVDGDGIPDAIVGVPGAGQQSGTATVLAGQSGEVLFVLEIDHRVPSVGYVVAGAGDVNADGHADLVVGDPGFGAARVFSGSDGALLFEHLGFSSHNFGTSVSGIDDIDGDDFDDYLYASGGAIKAPGEVFVHSGADGRLLQHLVGGRDLDSFGNYLAPVADVDSDGITDLIVGSLYGTSILSAASWTEIYMVPNNGPVADVGDLDGDGTPDVAVGSRVFSGVDGEPLLMVDDARTIVGPGDLDGDGHADLAVGLSLVNDAAGQLLFLRNQPVLVLHESSGTRTASHYGQAVAGVGDLDGDGHADILIGAPRDDSAGLNAGAARALSGADGHLHFESFGASGDHLGQAVASAGDVDGDGTPDLIVGAPHDGADAGGALLLAGEDGSVLLHVLGSQSGSLFGAAVAGVGDVDGDGHDDVVVGAPEEDVGAMEDAGVVRVYSGATGSVLLEVAGDHAKDRLGSSVAGVGDLDGDEGGDVLIGVPFDDLVATNAGSARVLSGADGSLLRSWAGETAQDRFGHAVAAAADVDGDGMRDVLVGAPRADPDEAGKAYLYSGSDGALLASWAGAGALAHLGSAVASVGDVDADDVPDMVLGAPAEGGGLDPGGIGRMLVASGATSTILFELSGDSGAAFGASVAAAGDLDGNGRPDLLVGAPNSGGGSVRAFGVPSVASPWIFLGSALVGSEGLPVLSGSGPVAPGTSASLHLFHALPRSPTFLVLGLAALGLTFQGGTLVPAPDAISVQSTDDTGEWKLAVQLPRSFPAALDVYVQAWLLDPAGPQGWAASNALGATTP